MTRKGLVWIKIVRKKTFKRDWRMLDKGVHALKRKWRVVCEPLANYEQNISIIGIVCNSETNNILIFSSFWFPQNFKRQFFSSQYASFYQQLRVFLFQECFCRSLKRFSLTFSFLTMEHILLARENGVFVKECHGWFNVNRTYSFESVGLLQISIQIFAPLLFYNFI